MFRQYWLIVFIIMSLALTGCSALWPFDEDLPDPGIQAGQNEGVFLPQISPTAGGDSQIYSTYLLDHSGRYLVPYGISIAKTEGIARAILNRLIDNEANTAVLAGTEFRLPFPAETTILGMTIRDGKAIVDFDSGFMKFADATHEKLALDALLYSLTEFSNIEQVELRVKGEAVSSLPSGAALVNPLCRTDRPLNLEGAAGIENSGTAKLYFSAAGPAGGLIYFVPVTRIIAADADPLAAVILSLLEGPPAESGLHGDIPAGTELLGIKVENGVAMVDFSSHLSSYGGGTAAENAMLGAIILSLTEISDVSSVKITIDGQVPTLPEGTDLSRPVSRPLFVNPFLL